MSEKSQRSTAAEHLRRDAQENRERLLAAAETVFAERGLDATVDDIARAAGVGLGTLYRRFSTKEALIEQLVYDLCQEVLAAGQEALEQSDATGIETLMWRIGELQAARRGCLTRLWTSNASEESVRKLDRMIATLLKRAQAAGTVRGDCTSTDVSLVMWGLRGVIETTAGVAPDAWRRHLDISLAGMRPGAVELEHTPISSAEKSAIRRLHLGSND